MRIRLIVYVIAAILIFTGASPWEGAATTAPEGELPVTGYYVATNSFPRNTLVDITNTETNRSVRVIVANGLDSPGLLAIVSREAAEFIGMRSGSISRVIMIQPSYPDAHRSFTEGMAAGIPFFDSGDVITEESLLDGIYMGDTYKPPVNASQNEPAPDSAVSGMTGPSYIVEPEWRTNWNIVDLPISDGIQHTERIVESAEKIIDKTYDYIAEPLPDEEVKEKPEYVEDQPLQEIAESVPEEEDQPIQEIAESVPEEEDQPLQEIAESVPEEEDQPIQEIAESVPEEDQPLQEIAESVPEEDQPLQEIAESVPEEEDQPLQEIAESVPEEEDQPLQEIAESVPEEEDQPIQEIAESVPEEEDQPIQEIAESVPEEEDQPIQEIAESVPEEEDQPLQEIAESVPEEDQPLQEIAEAPEQPRYIFVGANERQPEKTIYDIPLEDLIPGIVIRTPDREPVRQPAPVNERMFSVRTQLDRGWYYVQIAAFDSPEAVENALMKIDHSYLPVVYKGNDIWYRILLGPLNQGESAAVLQRFRSIGYTDAFIRQGW